MSADQSIFNIRLYIFIAVVVCLVTLFVLWRIGYFDYDNGLEDHIIDAFAPVCDGYGVDQAAAYSDGAGYHPVVLLDSSGDKHSWTTGILAEWCPASVADNELVICVGEERKEVVEVCVYVDGSDITRYEYSLDVELREAKTGETVASHTLYSRPRSCRDEERRSTTKLGSPVSLQKLEDWLEPYVLP